MKVTVSKVDEVFMHVDCDDGLAKDLHDFFSFKVPGAQSLCLPTKTNGGMVRSIFFQ